MLVLAGGCKKKTSYDVVEQNPYLGMPGLLDHLINFDISRLRLRDGFREFRQELLDDPQAGIIFEALDKRMGLNPLDDVDRVVVGVRGRVDPDDPVKNLLVLFQGRFSNADQMMEGLHQWVAEEYLIAPPPFRKSTHPGTDFKRFQTSGQSMYSEQNLVLELNFAILESPGGDGAGEDPSSPGRGLMVFSFNSALVAETLDVISGQMEGIQKDENWVTMLDRPDTSSFFWGTGNLDPAMTRGAQALSGLSKAGQYYFHLNLKTNPEAELGLVCDSIESAEALAGEIKTGIQSLKGLMPLVAMAAPETAKLPDKIVAIPKQEITRVILKLTESDHRALVNEWKALARQAEESGQLPLPLPGMMPPGGQQPFPGMPPPPGQPPQATPVQPQPGQ